MEGEIISRFLINSLTKINSLNTIKNKLRDPLEY